MGPPGEERSNGEAATCPGFLEVIGGIGEIVLDFGAMHAAVATAVSPPRGYSASASGLCPQVVSTLTPRLGDGSQTPVAHCFGGQRISKDAKPRSHVRHQQAQDNMRK